MDALRRYLSTYCRCDDETVARHVAAEEAGTPLRLPDLAYAVTMDFRLLQSACYVGELIGQERAERAAAANAAAKATPAPVTPQRATVLATKHKPSSAAAKRHAEIMSSWPAKLRPERAAQLAADRTISARDAVVMLSNMMTPAEVHAWNDARAPKVVDHSALLSPAPPVTEASGGFGFSWTAIPQTAAERAAADIEQFKAIVRGLPAHEGGRTIRIHG